MASALSKEFLDIQASTECRFTLRLARDTIIIFNQMHRTDEYSAQLNHFDSLTKWLSVRLREKWLWIRISSLSLKLQIWRLLRARIVDIQASIECRFTLRLVRDMIIIYSQMHHSDKYWQHSSIIWTVWLSELSVCGFASRCCHLNFRYGVCFKQGVP